MGFPASPLPLLVALGLPLIGGGGLGELKSAQASLPFGVFTALATILPLTLLAKKKEIYEEV